MYLSESSKCKLQNCIEQNLRYLVFFLLKSKYFILVSSMYIFKLYSHIRYTQVKHTPVLLQVLSECQSETED